MIKISELFGKFEKIARSGLEAEQAVVMACQQAGIPIRDPKKIKIRGSVVTLGLSPAQKSEVFLKQAKILAILKDNPLTKQIKVVR